MNNSIQLFQHIEAPPRINDFLLYIVPYFQPDTLASSLHFHFDDIPP